MNAFHLEQIAPSDSLGSSGKLPQRGASPHGPHPLRFGWLGRIEERLHPIGIACAVQ